MNRRSRDIALASGFFVLGALSMLLLFVIMVMWNGR